MPSPFPGMDPFIESQEWEDFHASAIAVIRELLTPRLGGHYAARIERRVYVEHMDDPEPDLMIAEVAIVPQSSDRAMVFAAPPPDADTQKWIDGILADRKSSTSAKT